MISRNEEWYKEMIHILKLIADGILRSLFFNEIMFEQGLTVVFHLRSRAIRFRDNDGSCNENRVDHLRYEIDIIGRS